MKHYFNKRIFSILLLGFSSGLPLGLITGTLQAWYTVSGVSIVAIGWLTLVGQPYAYKFLWAPLLDRWPLTRLGRRHSWILITQLLLAMSFAALAFMHPQKMPLTMAILALCIAFFSSTQDTAIDAYRSEILQTNERGVGASANTVAYRLAMMVSSAVALILAGKISWQVMYLTMATCFVVLSVGTVNAPKSETPLTAPTSLREAMTAPLKSFFSNYRLIDAVLILIFIVLYKLSDAMALSLNTTFLIRGVGFDLVQIGAVSKVVGVSAALLGSVIGGFLLPAIGVYRALFFFGVLQLASNLLYAWLAVVGKNILVMGIAIFGENFCSGLSTVAFIVFLMNLCDRRYTATHYALFSAVASLGRIFIGPVSAVLVEHFGWVDFYVMSSVVGLPSLFILWWLMNNVGEGVSVRSGV